MRIQVESRYKFRCGKQPHLAPRMPLSGKRAVFCRLKRSVLTTRKDREGPRYLHYSWPRWRICAIWFQRPLQRHDLAGMSGCALGGSHRRRRLDNEGWKLVVGTAMIALQAPCDSSIS